MSNVVTQQDVTQAFAALGIQEGDIVLVHSSLKSLGTLEMGPETVIRGIEKLIGKEGTLVMPTLCQVDFTNSYKTWYMDKPSDVGYLTEYFRKLPYVYRSNQATHSVAARGKHAYELTYEHGARGEHICPFGDTAFADSSPWVKMYEANAHIVFIGVDMMYNTMKHMIEGRVVEHFLGQIQDPKLRQQQKDRLRKFETFEAGGIWPFYNSRKMEEELKEAGLMQYAMCGTALLHHTRAKDSGDYTQQLLLKEPQKWMDEASYAWVQDCVRMS